MDIDLSQFIQTFFEETAEHLAAMEALLIRLDVTAPDAEELNAIFRAAHSIKGGAATFGFADLTEVTHILENQLDRVRKGSLALRTDMVDTFLAAGDALRGMLQAHQAGQEPEPDAASAVCSKLRALEGLSAMPQEVVTTTRWRLQLDPTDNDAAALSQLLSGLRSLGWEQDETAAPGCVLHAVNRDSAEQIGEALSFVLAPEEYRLTALDTDSPVKPAATAPATDGEGYGFFGPENAAEEVAILEEGDGFGLFAPLPEAASTVLEEGDGFGFFTPLATPTDAAAPTAAATTDLAAPTAPAQPAPLAAAGKSNEPAAGAKPPSESNSIRVGVEKVDHLINLVGELVITQAMLAQSASQFDPATHERLHNSIALLERNTRELQESAMSIRMMPISFVFSRFPRVVRDTAAKLDKKVRLITYGENTELDRGLIEKLADPLTHLIRNSLDHGIEKPDARLAKGKAEQGTLTLKAFHQGGNIIIQVHDDGAGLNRERILAKARAQGMNVSDAMADAEVWPLIFEPGFSTAETVTDVSGRGVGMDVVRRNIQGMGGRIEIDTAKDAGTRMTIRLPLTLAILDGMAMRIDRDVYVIPLAFIVESLQPRAADLKTLSGKGRVVHVRGEYLPIITLHEVFGMGGQTTQFEAGLFVILEAGGGKVALFVDDLLGQHQVVIKSLETNFRKVPGVSGATIMGDGRVALIIDVESLVRLSNGAEVEAGARVLQTSA